MITLDDYISKSDRIKSMKLGMLYKLAEAGMTKSEFKKSYINSFKLTKQAGISDTISKGLQGGIESAALVALLTGIPLGAATHYIIEAANRNSEKETQKIRKIKHYADKANAVELELSKNL
jgi:hypothetical protein